VRGVLLAPVAELGNLQALLDGLLVLMRVIVHSVTLATLQFDEIILRHIFA
jgi:hypothetical protein